MKSPAFDYVRADSIEHAQALLAQHGDDARVLAGGQTLLATLNMRLSQPTLLVDIAGLAGLSGISVVGNAIGNATGNAAGNATGNEIGNALRIGALTRHVDIEDSALVAQHAPLLAQAAPHIAHRAIRNRGTLGGALASTSVPPSASTQAGHSAAGSA